MPKKHDKKRAASIDFWRVANYSFARFVNSKRKRKMYLLRALSVIFGCLAVGEAVIYWTGWQLPGSVIGLGVLLALLHLGWVDVKWLVQMVNLLLDNLPLFLVPPCVAVMTYLDVVAKDFWSITIASILSTFAVLFATGKTHEWMRRR